MFPVGLEPTTFGFGGRRSIQLSYENGVHSAAGEHADEVVNSTVRYGNAGGFGCLRHREFVTFGGHHLYFF